jgi:hypothetical protein
MPVDKPSRRLPLRDLMTDAEKRSRDLIEKIGTTWLTRVTDLRDLSRPIRKRSPYPTLIALQNAIEKMLEIHLEVGELLEYLTHELDDIRDHARRERMTRR